MTIIAIVGWSLFLFTALLYWIGNKLNAKEINSLATYTVAVALSDDFRAGVRSGFEQVIEEGRAQELAPARVAYGLARGAVAHAKQCYELGAEVSTIHIVNDLVMKDT